jgi:1-aminocyclopropane-1-carboxylate synthase
MTRTRNAGFFLWIDLSPYLLSEDQKWEAETKLQAAIADAGVSLSSGVEYKSDQPGRFRVLFSLEEDALREALQRCGFLVI